jgi:protein dithiol:quinone oxidoreductase
MNPSPRPIRPAYYVLGFVICLGLLGTASYMQEVMKLTPCPLCIMQRLCVLLLGVLFFLGWVLPWRRKASLQVLHGFVLLFGATGLGVAARQVWLQSHPEAALAGCGPGLNFMFQNLPLKESIKLLFLGSGDCAEVQWHFLGFSIPQWTLLFFAGFMVYTVYLIYRCHRIKSTRSSR